MKKCWNSVKKFVKNQIGANTLEVVLILALAGIAGVGIYTIGQKIYNGASQKTQDVIDKPEYTADGENLDILA